MNRKACEVPYLPKHPGMEDDIGYCQLKDMKPKLSEFAPPGCTPSYPDHLLPNLKSLGAQNSIIEKGVKRPVL